MPTNLIRVFGVYKDLLFFLKPGVCSAKFNVHETFELAVQIFCDGCFGPPIPDYYVVELVFLRLESLDEIFRSYSTSFEEVIRIVWLSPSTYTISLQYFSWLEVRMCLRQLSLCGIHDVFTSEKDSDPLLTGLNVR